MTSTDMPGLPSAKRFDPLVDFSSPPLYYIDKSGIDSSFSQFNSPGTNIGSASFTIVPPSSRTSVMSRLLMLRVPLTFTINGTSTTGNLIDENSGIFAPRSWPLNNNISNVNLNLGGSAGNFSNQPYRITAALQHHHMYQEEVDVLYSQFPSLPDNCQDYSQLGPTALNNVLAPYKGSNFFCETRGSFPYSIISNSSTECVIEIIVTEPILLSPLNTNPLDKDYGFIGIQQASLNINFVNNFNRFWSFNSTGTGKTITSITAEMGNSTLSNCQLLAHFVNAPLEQIIPENIFYASKNYVYNQGTSQTINARSSSTMSVNGISSGNIPSLIYLYARRNDNQLIGASGFQYADGFASLTALTIKFQGRNLLSDATTQDLWAIAVKNGIKISWPSWVGAGQINVGTDNSIGVGSVLVLTPNDLGTNFGDAPGTPTQFNIDVSATFKNLSDSNIEFNFQVVLVYDQITSISKFSGPMVTASTLINEMDVVNAPIVESGIADLEDQIGGRSPMKGFKKFGKNFLKTVKKGIKEATKIAKDPLVKDIIGVVKDVYGKGGGAMMQQNDLRKRLELTNRNLLR